MKIEDLDKKIKELNKFKKLLKMEITEFEDVENIIFKKYLECERVASVAKFINDLGYRINNRKYIANDISDVITDKDIVINSKDLKLVVYKIFQSHKKGKRVFL